MLTLIKKFVGRCKDGGLADAIAVSCSFLKWKAKSLLGQVERNPIHARRLELAFEIDRLLSSTVGFGLFKGLRFAPGVWWGDTDRGGMLLGIYEQEILQSLNNVPPTHRTFIDIGAADGYYGIGVLINNMFDHSYCFETSDAGQDIIRKNAALNGMSQRISVRGDADPMFYRSIPNAKLPESVLLVDIEGAEFALFDKALFRALKGAVIFIELHDWLVEDGQEKLAKLRSDALEYFGITELTTTARDMSKFDILENFSDTDRWLICSEGRGRLMTWYRLDPKV